MSWRKKLLISDQTIEEKEAILRKRQERRTSFCVLLLILFFFSSFALSLFLVASRVLGAFPLGAIIGIFLWITCNLLFHFFVKKIRFFFLRKDKEIQTLIKRFEEAKRIWKKEFPD